MTAILTEGVKTFETLKVAQVAKCSVCGDRIPLAYPRDDGLIVCNDCMNPMICLGNLHAYGLAEEDESQLNTLIVGSEEQQELESQREEQQ